MSWRQQRFAGRDAGLGTYVYPDDGTLSNGPSNAHLYTDQHADQWTNANTGVHPDAF